ncbi:hypothetical protein [Vulcanococcus limneticus]|uniref:hypothetical protein n=1 Tax=Vulcanococcus limneticus TaxID=2170428 RepID=UPI00398BF951
MSTPLAAANRDALVENLHQTMQQLKENHARTPYRPMITAKAGRSVGEALIMIRILSRWGEFTKILRAVGLSQPKASICRRLAKDWHIIEAGNFQEYSAEVAYQKLLQKTNLGYT